MGGHSGKNSQIIGYKYYMSMLMGICQGPIDALTNITVGDQDAWDGSMTDESSIYINKGNLFGGQKGEGGVVGTLRSLFGSASQTVPSNIKNTIGSDAGVSDMRGIASVWFDGQVCAMNPYPKQWKFRVNRRMSGWDGPVWQPSLCEIDLTSTVSVESVDNGGTSTYKTVTGTIRAMNPAHILYQLLTDTVFGRGYPRTWIDDVGFLAAATQLKAEQFGLCTSWDTKNQELADFIQQIVNTIGASLHIDRTSGLITLMLIRGDYDPDMLPVFDRSSGLLDISEDQTGASGAEVNEQIVSYYDPIGNQTRQVRAQNLASMESLGYKNSTSTEYQAIPTAELAGRVAARDLKTQGTNLRRYTIKLDRRAWKVSPGSVFKIHVPERGIDNLILRAGDIRDSSLTDGTIQVAATIDVFGLPSQAYTNAVTSTWSPPPSGPVAATNYMAQEASYRALILAFGSSEIQSVDRQAGTIEVFAAKPVSTGLSFSMDVSTDGQTWSDDDDVAPFTDFGVTAAAMTRWTTQVVIEQLTGEDSIAVGQAVQIDDEIMRIDAWDESTGDLTVARGCVDTIPQPHDAGARAIFVDTGSLVEETEYGQGENVTARIITNMLNGSLDTDLAPTVTVGCWGRQGRPWPPANVQVNDEAFDGNPVISGDLTLTWAGRNRLTTQDVLISFGEQSQAVEANCQFRLVITSGGNTIDSIDIPGDTFEWTWTVAGQTAAFASDPIGSNEQRSVTFTLSSFFYDPSTKVFIDSYQSYVFDVLLTAPPPLQVTAEVLSTLTVFGGAIVSSKSIQAITVEGLSAPARFGAATVTVKPEGVEGTTLVLSMAWQPATITKHIYD